MYARNPSGERYLIDIRTGLDLSTPVELDEVTDPYGSVGTDGSGLQITTPT